MPVRGFLSDPVLRFAVLVAAVGLGACDLFEDDDFAPPPPGSGQMCAGIAGVACPGELLCDLAAGQCNTADGAGLCVQIADVCTADFVPVCGCDGVTYGNDCLRQMARVAKDHDGACAPAGPQPS